jgi:multicomponent Na+:H+ antiporter subunit E
VALAIFWWILSGPGLDGWWAGLIAVTMGMALHHVLGGSGPRVFRLARLPAFAPWFLLQSIRGGIDVARRAFAPSLPLEPGFLRYPSRLPEGPARVFFVNCISLLPGTFSADLEDDVVRVHLLAELDRGPSRLAALETRVARLFNVAEPPEPTPEESAP